MAAIYGTLKRGTIILPNLNFSWHTVNEPIVWYTTDTDASGNFVTDLPDGDFIIEGIWVSELSEWNVINYVFSVRNKLLVGDSKLRLNAKPGYPEDAVDVADALRVKVKKNQPESLPVTDNLAPPVISQTTLFEEVETFEADVDRWEQFGSWYQTSTRAYSGAYSFRSAAISHDQTSIHHFIEIYAPWNDPKLSFYYYLSTEKSWDLFRVYINEVLVLTDSGETGGWKYFEIPLVPNSDNNLRFDYTKDRSASYGEDAVFVDNLTLSYREPLTVHQKTVTDTLSLADSITSNVTTFIPTDGWDVYTWNNAYWDIILKQHTAADNAALADSVGLKPRKSITDTATLAEGFNKKIKPKAGDTTTLTDSAAIKAQATLSDTLSLASTIANKVQTPAADTISLADAIQAKAQLQITEALSLLDALAAVVKTSFDDSVSVGDEGIPRLMVLFQEAVSVSDSILALYQAVFGESLAVTDLLANRTNRPLGDDAVTSSDALSLRSQPSLSDTIDLVDSVAAAVAAYRSSILTLADQLSIATKADRADVLNLLDEIATSVAKQDLDSAASLADDLAKKVIPEALIDNLGLADDGTAKASPFTADNASTADAIVKKVQDYLEDFLALADSAKAKASDRNDDTATPTDTLAIVTKRLLADTETLTDDIARAYGTGVLTPGTFDFGRFDEANFDNTGDPINLEDALTIKQGYGTLGADLLALADAIQVAVKDVLADGVTLTDSTAAKVKDFVDDTITLTDSEDAKTGKNTGDTSKLSDSASGALNMPRTAGDSSLSLADSSSLEARPNVGDSVSVGDSDEGKTIGPGPGDTTGVGDTATFSFKKDLDDLLALSDSLLRSVAAIVGDTFPVADQLTLATKAVAAEIALSLADDNKLKAMTLLGDLMTLSDDHIKNIAKTIDDVGTVNDALANRIGAILNSVTTLADTFALSVTLGVVDDIIGVADSINTITRLIIGSSFDMAAWDNGAFDTTGDLVAVSESISLLISLAIADSLTVDDDTTAAIKLRFIEAINLVDSILGLYAAALNSNLPISDTIGLKNMKTLADTVPLADSLANKYEMAELQEAISLAEDLILKAKVTGAETVSLQDAIDLVAGFGTSLSDTTTVSDTAYIEARKQLADTLTLVDNLQTKAKLSIDEAIAAADILGVMTRREAADTIDLMDEIARLYRCILGGSWDSVGWDGGQFDTSGDIIQVDDGYRFALSAILQEAIATNDTLKAKVGLKLADDSYIMDGILNGLTKAAAETMGVSDELLQLIIGLRNDTSLSLEELLSKRTGLPPDDSSMVTDSIIASLKLARSANDLIAATDNAIAKVKAMLKDAAVLTDSLALSTKRAVEEAITVAEKLGLKTKRPVSSNGVGIIDELFLKYALGIAWDEEGVADSIRGKVKTLLQQVFINGVSIPVNGLNIRHSGNDRVSTATFRIHSPTSEVLSLAKQKAPVNIYLVDGVGNTDYFGGRIVGNPTNARGTITTEMEVTVDDWTAAAQDVYVIESFPEDFGTIDEALRYLWSKYYGYSINLDKVAPTAKRMPSMVFNYLTLFDVTERLAQLLGWSWHVEWNGAERVLQFYPPSAAVQPVTLSREARNIVAGTARFGQDDNMANVVYVFGGKGLSNPYTQKIVADGQNTIYKLGSKPHRIDEGSDGGIKVTIVKPDGTRFNQTIGIMNLHQEEEFDVLLDFNEGTLRWRDENKPKEYEDGTRDVIEAIYRYTYPIMVQLTDENSIRQYGGKFETTINDSSLNDIVAARELGRAILRDRAHPKGFGSCEVNVPGLRAGQFITVDLSVYNTKGLFEITEIEKWIQGGTVRRRVTLNKADDAESRIAQRLKDFAKRLASLESSNRQEDLVVQRWLKGPANIGARVVGSVTGNIEESGASHLPPPTDDYILTWKTSDKSRTWATDKTFSLDTIKKVSKPRKLDTVATVSKISGGITFFDVHTFDDKSHPFGM
jgi:hypothetical protein